MGTPAAASSSAGGACGGENRGNGGGGDNQQAPKKVKPIDKVAGSIFKQCTAKVSDVRTLLAKMDLATNEQLQLVLNYVTMYIFSWVTCIYIYIEIIDRCYVCG